MRNYQILSVDGDLRSPQEKGRSPGSISGESEARPNENMVSLLKTMSHELRGSLVSMVSTLKLLNRGYYGKMDEEAAQKIREVLLSATRLTGMAEEYLGRAFGASGELEIEGKPPYLSHNRVNPVPGELSPELKDHGTKMGEPQRR
jgi:signal transduction histidine kinase